MLRSALLAFALAVPSPTTSDPPAPTPVIQTPASIAQMVIRAMSSVPPQYASRKKFPRDPAQLIDALTFINKVVNGGIAYEDDYHHYGVGDFWVTLPADAKGDCEDYALTKLFFISQYDDYAGDPVDEVTNTKIVGVMVHFVANGKADADGHAILAVKLPSGTVAYLDLNNQELMTRRELQNQGYEFFDWRA